MSDQLKSLAERIERLMDEQDGIKSDIRDLYTEVKSAGYMPKVLRKAIARKRMDPSKRDEEDAILELYEGVLGRVGKALAAVRAGSTWKEAAENNGVPRATLARAVAVSKRQAESRTDTNPETAVGNPPGGGEGTADVTSGPGVSPADLSCGGEPSNLTSETLEATVSEGPAHQHATGDAGTAEVASLGPSLMDVASRCEPGPQDTIDPGPIPHFLKRERATG